MHSPGFRRNVVTLTGAFLLSAALAACGGGGGGSTLPSDPQQPQATNNGNNQNAAPITSAAATSIHVTTSDQAAAASAKANKGHEYMPSTGKKATAQSVVYPADLTYFGGALVTTARVYNAFVDSTGAPFGNPNSFEEHLSYSNMMHMTDEYVHSTASNRYDWAGDVGVNYSAFTTLGDNDLLAIIHAVAKGTAGGGYNHIYHIFLPKGIDYCSTGTLLPLGDCNASATSPHPAFCAFHGSVVFTDIKETLYTIEPFQDTDFCGVNNATSNPNAPTPNGLQNDSTYSTLSHETFETITDPDPGSGWYTNNVGISGEIGDLCAYLAEDTNLSGKVYHIQREYSDAQHACNNTTP